jgi:hypothetical protein
MANVDAESSPAIEDALFQLPLLERRCGASVTAVLTAMRNALAAPMRTWRTGSLTRAHLLHELAHMLLVSVPDAQYARPDVAAIAAAVGASAAAQRRAVPSELLEEALALLRLAVVEQRVDEAALAARTVDRVADDLTLTLLRRAAVHELIDVSEYAARARAPCDAYAQLQFALALAAAHRPELALAQLRVWLDRQALDGARTRTPHAHTVHLLAAKLLLNDLRRPLDALAHARLAVDLVSAGDAAGGSASAHAAADACAQRALGVASAAAARTKGTSTRRRRQLVHDSLNALRRAARLQPTSAATALALALAHADARAIEPVRVCVRVSWR